VSESVPLTFPESNNLPMLIGPSLHWRRREQGERSPVITISRRRRNSKFALLDCDLWRVRGRRTPPSFSLSQQARVEALLDSASRVPGIGVTASGFVAQVPVERVDALAREVEAVVVEALAECEAEYVLDNFWRMHREEFLRTATQAEVEDLERWYDS
jgi:hypothetical protein